jgi:L-ascorbate metabolism protein UlaG (beta-lactamase superfamily)
MLGTRSINFLARPAVLLVSVILASVLAASGVLAQAPPNAAQGGTVKVEWLGNIFYRLTSPEGVVVLTSPQLANADGPVELDELGRTDIILVPNSHNDDMGNPLEIAAVSGATVIAPGPLGRWLIDNGLDQRQFRRAGVGDLFTMNNLRFKIAPSAHDNTLATGAAGGPAASFFVTFENGFTVFFNGHSTIISELAIYSATYQPDLAILGLTDALEFAQVARLMAMDNPKLRTIIPGHMRPGAPILSQARAELDRLGLGHLMFVPELRRVYEY